jgi:hypothetical protein
MLRAVDSSAAGANRLALIRAFCLLRRPSTCSLRPPVHNFFSQCKRGIAHAGEHANRRANGVRFMRGRAELEICDSAKRHMPWAFSHHRELFAHNHADENFFVASLTRHTRRARGARTGGGCYAHNYVESLLFFSCCSNPMLVHVDSRLHCTDVAIHSS